RVGARRPVLGPARDGAAVPHVVAALVREEVPHADARDRRRAGLSRAVHREPRALRRAAAARSAVAPRGVSRRGALGAQAAEQAALVAAGARMARALARGGRHAVRHCAAPRAVHRSMDESRVTAGREGPMSRLGIASALALALAACSTGSGGPTVT